MPPSIKWYLSLTRHVMNILKGYWWSTMSKWMSNYLLLKERALSPTDISGRIILTKIGVKYQAPSMLSQMSLYFTLDSVI